MKAISDYAVRPIRDLRQKDDLRETRGDGIRDPHGAWRSCNLFAREGWWIVEFQGFTHLQSGLPEGRCKPFFPTAVVVLRSVFPPDIRL